MDAHYIKLISPQDLHFTSIRQTRQDKTERSIFIKKSLFHELENLEPYASMVPIRLCFVPK